MQPVISVQSFSFRYQAAEVLSSITFDVSAGDYVALVGPNGSGKTTLIRALLGLVSAPDDAVSLFGISASTFTDWHLIGYLPQKLDTINPAFPATVREIVATGRLSTKGLPKRLRRDDHSAVDDILSLLDITRLQDRLIGELSGGQQQRTLLARALVNDPQLLILDEPSTALDPESREKFYALLQHLNHDKGVTIIIVTHDMGTIGRYARKMLYLDKRIVFYGGFDDFCRSEEITRYFGSFAQHVICHRH